MGRFSDASSAAYALKCQLSVRNRWKFQHSIRWTGEENGICKNYEHA